MLKIILAEKVRQKLSLKRNPTMLRRPKGITAEGNRVELKNEKVSCSRIGVEIDAAAANAGQR